MNVLMVGSTGFIGRATLAYLQGKGHRVAAWVRDSEKAIDLLGEGIRIVGPFVDPTDLRKELEWADCVVNLAGRPLAGVRWTQKKKKDFEDSRIGLTNLITEEISNCQNPPSVFVSASAVGYYGDRGTEILTERSSKGEDYLAGLCSSWEESAHKAEEYGVRVCTLRLGIVLGREGGILKQVLPGFEIGLGTYTGDGSQQLPWIHLADVARAIEFCISDERVTGPVNITSPKPSTSKQFALELGGVTNAKILLPIGSFPLKVIFGEGATVLTNSQKAIPQKLQDLGFEFIYTTLNDVFKDEVTPDSVTIQRVKDQNLLPQGIKGDYILETEVSLKTGSEETFGFFSSPLNLGLSTPSWVGFKIKEMPNEVREGSVITYRIKVGPIPLKWKTVIWEWNPNDSFIDFQEKGPYKVWHHEHEIIPNGPGASIMKDSVTYTIPGGLVGRIIHAIFIKKTLIRIFGYRRRVIQLRFGREIYA